MDWKNNGWHTARARKDISVPMKEILKGVSLEGKRGLDYGAGRGFDADALGLEKYDPNPKWGYDSIPEGRFDYIFCNYVLNVVDPSHVGVVVRDITSRLIEGGEAYFSVRADIPTTVKGKTQYDVFLDQVDSSAKLVKEVKGKYRIYKILNGVTLEDMEKTV